MGEKQGSRASKRDMAAFNQGRRDFIIKLSVAAVGGPAVVAGGVALYNSLTASEQQIPTDSFTGEAADTKSKLIQWGKEVGSSSSRLEAYMPRINALSSAYFARQMATMFPKRATDYAISRFKDAFVILNGTAFTQQGETCAGPLDSRTPALTDPFTGKIYISPQKLASLAGTGKNLTELGFMMNTHELLHFAPPLKKYVPGIRMLGIGGDVLYQQGLRALIRNDKLSLLRNKTCFDTSWLQLEETVVEDAMIRMVKPIISEQNPSGYLGWVNDYNSRVLSYYGGDFLPLLELQQTTQLDGFHRSIGEKLGKTTFKDQHEAGFRLTASLYPQ